MTSAWRLGQPEPEQPAGPCSGRPTGPRPKHTPDSDSIRTRSTALQVATVLSEDRATRLQVQVEPSQGHHDDVTRTRKAAAPGVQDVRVGDSD
jgi:hypothetical protein